MIAIAISMLWFLLGVVILCAIVYFVLYVIRSVLAYPIPARVEQMIWIVVLILVLIGLLTALMGGGAPRFPSLRGEPGGAPATVSASAATYMRPMLNARC